MDEPKSYSVKCKNKCDDVDIWFNKRNQKNRLTDDPQLYVSENDKPVIKNGLCDSCADVCVSDTGESFCQMRNVSGDSFFLTISNDRNLEDLSLYLTNVDVVSEFGE